MKAKALVLLCILLSLTGFSQSSRAKHLRTGWYFISATPSDYHRKLDRTEDYYYIYNFPFVARKNIKSFKIYKNTHGYYCLKMQLDSASIYAWNYAVEMEKKNKLAFIVDNKLMYSPYVNGQIHDGIVEIDRRDIKKKRYRKIIKTIKKEDREEAQLLKELAKKAKAKAKK